MQYRHLGRCGVQLSTVGLGSYLTIGMHVDEEAARQQVKLCFDSGVNWFDTANAYNKGQAEIALGKILKDHPRASFVLATKVFAPMGEGVNDRGLSAKHIREQCEASLRRLQVDYVDLYQCHRPDPGTPVEETVRAMEDLARAGRIIYWGVSEWPAALIQEAVDTAYRLGCRPPVSNQPRYSLLWRNPEVEVFATTLKLGLGNVAFSPLAHGMLTGKYAPGQAPPAGTRAADDSTNRVIMNLYWTEENQRKAQQLKAMAGDLGLSAAQLALAWCLRHPAVTSLIMGATRLEQLRDNIKAAEATLPDDVAARCEELFPLPRSLAP